MSVLTIYPSADTYVDQSLPTTNFGVLGKMIAGSDTNVGGSAGLCRMWMKFDLSSIPAGSTINTAVVQEMFFFPFTGYVVATFDIKRCTDTSWTEGGLTWNNAPNGSIAGSATDFMDVDFTVVGQFFEHTFTVTTDVAAALASNAVSWVIVNRTEADGSGVNGGTKEYAMSRPYLLVNYTEPVGGRRRSSIVF